MNTIINSIYQTNLFSPNKRNTEYDKLMKTFQKFKKPSFNGNNNSNNSKSNYNSSSNNNNTNSQNVLNINKEQPKKKKHGRCNSIYGTNNKNENNYNLEGSIKNNIRTQSKKAMNNINNNINNNNNNDNLNSLNINFNNYTNNFNYNYNINSNNINNINNTNNNNNGNINFNNNNTNTNNKGKSNSQKMIIGKVGTKNENTCKGIPINGFDKLISKKYNTRNFNIPMSATDRVKQSNIYYTSIASSNTYTNRYKNSHSRRINNNNKEHKK